LNYYWTDCPNCHCHVAVQWTAYPDRLSGSVRRWSVDRTINDGRPFDVPAAEVSAEKGFATACVCGQVLAVPAKPSAVGGERGDDFRVKLESS
jgi:hypothetical protein